MNREQQTMKQMLLRQIAESKEWTLTLTSVLWSEEELRRHREVLDTSSRRIDDMVEMIVKNLYWYQSVGWRRFVPNREEVERYAAATDMQDEKRRINDWLNGSDSARGFYQDFHRNVPENAVMERIADHNFSSSPHEWRILDVGCRDGKWLRKFAELGVDAGRLVGVEPYGRDREMLDEGQGKAFNVLTDYPDDLPMKDAQTDIILLFGFMMNVLDGNLRRSIGSELLRVLSPHGMIIEVEPTEQFLAKLDPYIAYASQALDGDSIQTIFPQCDVKFESGGDMCVFWITRATRTWEGDEWKLTPPTT